MCVCTNICCTTTVIVHTATLWLRRPFLSVPDSPLVILLHMYLLPGPWTPHGTACKVSGFLCPLHKSCLHLRSTQVALRSGPQIWTILLQRNPARSWDKSCLRLSFTLDLRSESQTWAVLLQKNKSWDFTSCVFVHRGSCAS